MEQVALSAFPRQFGNLVRTARQNMITFFISHDNANAPAWVRKVLDTLNAMISNQYVDHLMYEPPGIVSIVDCQIVSEYDCVYWDVVDGGRLIAWTRPN